MKRRITLVFSVLIVLITVCSGIFSYTIFKNAYYDASESNLRHNAAYVTENLVPQSFGVADSEVLERYALDTNQRITVIDLQGNVIYESLNGIDTTENHLNRPEVKKALAGETSSAVRYSDSVKKNMLYLATPYREDGQITRVVRLAVPLDMLEEVSLGIVNNLIFVALVSVIIAIVLFAFLLNNETKPLDEASAFAKKIARGAYDSRLAMIRDDKIGELVGSLNQMAEQLGESFEKINRKNLELSSVLSSMNHGIIAVDGDNRIILINDAARRIFGIEMDREVKGSNILQVYRDPFVYELQDHLEAGEGRLNYETKIGDQIFKVTSTEMLDKAEHSYLGNIIVLENITQIRGLENIRRDFVANISHELKTPITTIRGFIETIQENHITDEATLERFYGIIVSESDRLTRLVNDILTLSHLENKQRKGDDEALERMAVEGEIRQIFDILRQSAQEKDIALKFNCEAELFIEINPDDFRQTMINLVDNAIKYTDDGGTVEVSAYQNDGKLCVVVQDNGCGIPEKDIPRIFERFYRVDKSRSKAKGGTGLGLAIVKHIVQNNGGSIEVQSEVGLGTAFRVVLPLKRDN
ncbi:MAG: ATP-binding protein [Eubacterium sp.]|nr:ATP-binding protein [Eubacterium sp.]